MSKALLLFPALCLAGCASNPSTLELRDMFIVPGTISLRDTNNFSIRNDVSEAIRQHLTADNCVYFLEDSYFVYDWAVNIAMSIDGLPLENNDEIEEYNDE